MSEFFLELSIVMGITLIISFIMSRLKQPLLIGYILTGLIAGPLFFNLLSSTEGYQSFSHIGVALLLFIVGLHLNLKLIKEIGIVSLIAGSVQILITALFGFLISNFFNFTLIESMIIAIGVSFSSTIVIVKLLTDKKEIEKVPGKLTMGILIVQDLVAVISLMVISSIASASADANLTTELIRTFILGFVALFLVLIFSKLVLERLLDLIAESQDLLFIFVISWVLGVSALFANLGFSIEIGALLAGVALASSPYQFEISSKVKPLRDFFIVMFFILLGSQMIPVSETLTHQDIFTENQSFSDSIYGLFNNISKSFSYMVNNFSIVLVPALILSLFVILIKPIIVFILLNLLGFHKKVNFNTGVSLGQISEFSLILAIIASTSGLISSSVISTITLIAIITIAISTYTIMHSRNIYLKLKRVLEKIEIRKIHRRNAEKEVDKQQEILVFGYDRIGYSLLKTIEKIHKKYVVIDYNPQIIKKLESKQVPCIYGDANDIEFINDFNLENIQLLISTIPDFETNMILIKEFKKKNHQATIILTSNQIEESLELYKEGADYVILPHFLGGDYVGTLIENYSGDFSNFLKEKVKHINELKNRKKFGHEHPRY